MASKKRLLYLASFLKGYDCVLDIGTDHGFVLKEALDKGYIKKGIASDIGDKPLNQAKKNLKGYAVDFVQSNGFLNIEQPYDLVVIAGMGSHTIIDILSQEHDKKTYILQANDKYDLLRTYLFEHGYQIIDEEVIYDKFYYVIMKVSYGKQDYLDEDIYVGPILKTKKSASKYFKYQVQRYSHIIKQADKNTAEKYQKILSYYLKYL
ncbi:class I SAM-dependent methyltransferase [Mycoplasmatota bacterium]|nr:class I SAM-dependent methyltransferase [Mycoplasmatota bacterium]